MTTFALPEELVDAFRAAHARPRPLFEIGAARRAPCTDLEALPEDAEYVVTTGEARGLDRLARLSRLKVVRAIGVTRALVDALAAHPTLMALKLYRVGRADLAPLAGLPALEHLLVDWAPHLVDLSWLARLPRLWTLSINDAARVDLDTLPSLPRLRAFDLQGGMTRRLAVRSHAPVLRAPSLEHLSFRNVRAADGDLQVLGGLRQLRELFVPNFYPVAECARLAARLPGVDGSILRPIWQEPMRDSRGEPLLPCARCGQPRTMLTGKPALVLCPDCDQARIAKRVGAWEIARAAASA